MPKRERHPVKSSVNTAIETRRRKVAALMLAGTVNQTELAAAVGVSRPTIANDITAIKDIWRQETAHDVGVYKARAILRIQALIAAIWPMAMQGDMRAVGRLVELMAREAKIVGYDSAEKVDHHVNIRLAAQQVAEQLGLDVADVLAEAHRILESQVTA